MPNTVNLGGYTISFLGTQCLDELETWTYSISKNGNPQPEIISWTLELCFNPLHNVISSTGPGALVIGQGKPCIPMVGRSIKWDQLNNDIVEGIYTFILEGCYQKTERQVAIYAGPFCHRALITGPSCEEKCIEETIPEDDMVPEQTLETPTEYFEEEQPSEKVIEQLGNQVDQQLGEELLNPAEELQDAPPEFLTRGIRIF